MNSLPPLRTVRDAGSSPSTPSTPVPNLRTVGALPAPSLSALARPHHQQPLDGPKLDFPGLPRPARELLVEIANQQLLGLDQITEFVQSVGLRAVQLTSRERTADALMGLGYLSHFVCTRLLSGQVHGLVYGSYRLIDRLASGSVGTVFLAEHTRLRRKVALKTMPVDDTIPQQLLDRFELEARLLAGLDHPHIVKVYDIGTLPTGGPGLPEMRYQAQEYIAGSDMESFVYEQGQPAVPVACVWGRQIASALKACHSSGLIHRDVKPSNLLVTEQQRVKLVDFGLARDYASVRTPNRVLLGSLEFLAPEQVAEPATAGPSADIYGLGATLFWLVTGQLPYPQVESQSEALENIRTKRPRRASEIRPDLPKELDQLLSKMLARNPGDRPSLDEIYAALAWEGCYSPIAPTSAPIALGEDVATEQTVRQLEDKLTLSQQQLASSRQAVLALLSAVAANSPGETVEHQKRVARSVRVLAPYLATKPNWPMLADPRQVDEYARAIAAHDLGLVVLGQGGHQLEVHTTIGDSILAACVQEGGSALPFLRNLRSVVRHHHEAWNGTGFPDQLKEDRIPAIARVAAILISYDDLRRGALGEPPLSHVEAARRIIGQSGKLFDPDVVKAFQDCEAELDRHFWDVLEPGLEPQPLQPLTREADKTGPASRAPLSGPKAGLPLRRWGAISESKKGLS